MRYVTTCSILVAGLSLSASAFAGHYGETDYDLARVVSVDPIIETVSHPVENEVCWNEPVRYREPVHYDRGRRSAAGPVLGAIVGGVIGNQIGRGRGRDAATVAGAALGYAIAHDDQRRYDRGGRGGYRERVVYSDERRCRIDTSYREEQRVTGYDVSYRYRGRIHHTVTDYHPGDTIRVAVQVQAVR
ncbi:MAG: glycine zipper 2TM domain-containing protein [Lysobacterales bacterium]